MHALVYRGPGVKEWTEVPDPSLTADTDAIVRVDAVTLCGTDLHILKGDVPSVTPGRILGHEAVGTVLATGSAVQSVTAGDRVLVSCITACGTCHYCRLQMHGQCLGGGGWILGNTIDGTQAEVVRVPFAEGSLHLAPAGVRDEHLLMLADILPTAYEVGVLNGRLRTGGVIAVVGAGPIGLAAVLAAKLISPSLVIAIDTDPGRLQLAKSFGADVVVDNGHEDALEVVRGLTDGLGADVAVEAAGVEATFTLATTLVRPGGTVANVGVHGAPATLHLEELWNRDVTITTGLVDTSSTAMLLSLMKNGVLDASRFVTHHFDLEQMLEAYDVFGNAQTSHALKVVLTRS